MTGLGEKEEGIALWRRWRSHARAAAEDGGADNALLLAAYIDSRLATARAEAVEEWLADHPEALDDVIAARTSTGLPASPDSIVARAQALVAPRDETVISFTRRPAGLHGWRAAAAWGGLAASLLATSLFGFALGSNAYFDVMGQPVSPESTFHQLLDPPGQLFSMEEEEAVT
jgi:anti-sigma factor RsiW